MEVSVEQDLKKNTRFGQRNSFLSFWRTNVLGALFGAGWLAVRLGAPGTPGAPLESHGRQRLAGGLPPGPGCGCFMLQLAGRARRSSCVQPRARARLLSSGDILGCGRESSATNSLSLNPWDSVLHWRVFPFTIEKSLHPIEALV